MKEIYSTKATAVGGRNGHVSTEDGLLNLDVRMPRTLGGKGGDYTNPEQLFACGYAACFDSALNLVARMEKMRIESKTSATVGLIMNDDNTLSLSVKMEVKIVDLNKEKAKELVDKAHQVCPYSRATRNNIDVELIVK